MLPETLTVAPAGMAVGVAVSFTGRYRWSVWIGWILTTLGAGLLLLLEPGTGTAAWIFINVPIGMGTGMLFPALSLSIQAACTPALNGQAAAFFSFLRTFGQSTGVAVSGVIFQNVLRRELQRLPAYAARAGDYSRDATVLVSVIRAMPGGEAKSQLVGAYNDALQAIYVSMIAFAGFCLVLSVSIKGYSLEQEHVTQQGLIQQDRGEGVGEKGARDLEAARA